MNDLPTVTVQQQANARRVSAEDLEVMGKAAAQAYHDGEHGTLSDAVVETVKKAGLSPEQVKRVIEFTNVNAHQMAFQKEADHKVIEFSGGPASPSDVLKDLNDGGGGTVFDRGDNDYKMPPPEGTKTSMAKVAGLDFDPAETAFMEVFKSEDRPLPYADPVKEAMDLRDKLAAARDYFNSELSAHETLFLDAGDLLFGQVKQAALDGVSLGRMVQAWSSTTDEPEYVKLAFEALTPRLIENEVFADKDELSASIADIEKTASLVNPEHPLVETFVDYCQVLTKLAELRQARAECDQHFDTMTSFIKEAGGLVSKAVGLVPKVLEGAKAVSVPAGNIARNVGTMIGGEAAGNVAGKLVGGAVKYAPHAAGALAAEELYQRARYNRPIQTVKNFLLARVPYTRQNLIRQYSLQH